MIGLTLGFAGPLILHVGPQKWLAFDCRLTHFKEKEKEGEGQRGKRSNNIEREERDVLQGDIFCHIHQHIEAQEQEFVLLLQRRRVLGFCQSPCKAFVELLDFPVDDLDSTLVNVHVDLENKLFKSSQALVRTQTTQTLMPEKEGQRVPGWGAVR